MAILIGLAWSSGCGTRTGRPPCRQVADRQPHRAGIPRAVRPHRPRGSGRWLGRGCRSPGMSPPPPAGADAPPAAGAGAPSPAGAGAPPPAGAGAPPPAGAGTPPPAGVFALLADSSTAEIRAAGPDDFAAVRSMHEAMSPQNLYLRFFSLSKNAAEQEARRLCRPAGPDHAALLACLNAVVVGAASYEPTNAPGTAEVAFAVADDMHGRGVATLLLGHLVSLARSRDLTALSAETLPENSAMLRVFGDAGLGVLRHWADGVVELSIPIPRQAALGQDSPYLDAVARRERRADRSSA